MQEEATEKCPFEDKQDDSSELEDDSCDVIPDEDG
jgi:hypothetical protein